MGHGDPANATSHNPQPEAMTTTTTYYRIRMTHDSDLKPFRRAITEPTGPNSYRVVRMEDHPKPWRVLCESHANYERSTHGRHDCDPLDGDWTCTECNKFTWAEESRLKNALASPKFAHTRRRGFYSQIGMIYFRDPASPTGVFAASDDKGRLGFDPYCPAAMAIVNGAASLEPRP